MLDPIVKGFPLESLPSGTTLVDVGGGNGGLCISLAKQFVSVSAQISTIQLPNLPIFSYPSSYPNFYLKYVVQDLPDTIKSANLHIKEVFQYAINENHHANVVELNGGEEGVVDSTPPPSDRDITPPHPNIEMERMENVTVIAESHDFFSAQPRMGDEYSYCLKLVL